MGVARKAPAASEVSVRIDGADVSIAANGTVLDAARAAGRRVPTLCHSERLEPHGACRTCLVEQSDGKLVAACHTPVADGQSYTTRSERLTRLRRNIVELIVSDHPLECLTCSANGRCDLQTLAQEVGLRESRYESPRVHTPPRDDSHPFIKLDMEKCIGCGRCVRACDETQASFVLGMSGRGYDAKVIAGADTGLEEADCASCGQCVLECPVAAMEEPGTRLHGTPDATVTTTCGYCAVGCTLDVHTKDGAVVNIEPNADGSANRGHACVKGRFAHQYTRSGDRLRSPLIRQADGTFREASWDEALGLIATEFARVRDTHGPMAFGAISSSRCTNEENFAMQKFARVVMRTNTVDNCSRVCHSPSAYALRNALGAGAGTNSFQCVETSDLLMVVGANSTEAHPVFGSRIKRAALAGATLIVLDPRNIELARMADAHLPLRPGSNVAVINAMQHVLIHEGLVDAEFIAAHSEGYDALRAELAEYTPEWAAPISGVDPDAIRDAARMYGGASCAQILWGLGVTEAGHGSNAAFGLINMAVMTGNMGREGAGASPIRGQNNVQGASDVGALPHVVSDYRPIGDATTRAAHREAWGVDLPEAEGLRIPDMLDAAHSGHLKAMYVMAEDIAQSDPHVAHVIGALERLEFLVVQEIFMTPTAELADVVLPGAAFLEKDGSFVNSDRRIQRVRKAVDPPGEALADGDIINAVARRMGHDLGFDDGPGAPVEPSRIMAEIAALSPKWGGVSYERIEEIGFLQWPCEDINHPGTEIMHRDGAFLSGKAALTPTPWQEPGELPDHEYPLMLTTGRQLFHYNVGSMTRRTDVTQLSKAERETVRIHPKDAGRLGVDHGEVVSVVSRRGSVLVPVEVTRATNPGVVFMTFHWPETRTNILVGSAVDEYTGCPEYKVAAVRIERASTPSTPV